MTNPIGPGGMSSNPRRMQRAIDQLRLEVQRLEALVEALTRRLEALEGDE